MTRQIQLTALAYHHQILKLARTIVDLAGEARRILRRRYGGCWTKSAPMLRGKGQVIQDIASASSSHTCG